MKTTFSFRIDMSEGWRCPPHQHHVTEVVFCFDCEGSLFLGDEQLTYADDNVIVIRPDESHWVTNRTPGLQYCYGIEGAGADAIPTGVYRPNGDLESVRQMLVESFIESSGNAGGRLDLLCGLSATIIAQIADQPIETASRIERVHRLVEERYGDDWDTNTLAYRVGLSPDYLRHAFQARYGVSVARFLKETRIAAALRLLETTDEPINRVALLSGFRDASYFSKVFRKQFFRSPSDYRIAEQREPDIAQRYDGQNIDFNPYEIGEGVDSNT